MKYERNPTAWIYLSDINPTLEPPLEKHLANVRARWNYCIHAWMNERRWMIFEVITNTIHKCKSIIESNVHTLLLISKWFLLKTLNTEHTRSNSRIQKYIQNCQNIWFTRRQTKWNQSRGTVHFSFKQTISGDKLTLLPESAGYPHMN